MSRMFYEAWSFDRDLSNFDVSSVEDMSSMFAYAYRYDSMTKLHELHVSFTSLLIFIANSFTGLGISGWDVSNVYSMNSMFQGTRR